MNTSYNDINQVATGARIREIRKAKGLKVTDISNYMGFESPQAVYKWQRGDSLPDLGNMMRLLELFQIRDIREIVVMTGSADEALPFQISPFSCLPFLQADLRDLFLKYPQRCLLWGEFQVLHHANRPRLLP
ncbi:MAG: helix-turn-helix domain-containing protein [Lachnospiraceae bacterium]|nr:helix-turn-helix domain-containing protein [Lachnospiraceae bacterium]